MADPRPVGMRVPRPYATEEEFLRGDGAGIGRSGMVLFGAPSRTPGVVVRFEIVLSDGTVVFRGEGRVVAHRVQPDGRKGLEVRFTRLDSHSKGIVERAVELRKSGAVTPSPPTSSLAELTPVPNAVPSAGKVAAERSDAEDATHRATALSEGTPAQAEPRRVPRPSQRPSPPEAEVETATRDAGVLAGRGALPGEADAAENTIPMVVPVVPEPASEQREERERAFGSHVSERGGETRAADLEKLRERHAAVERPQDRESLLDKLRKRLRSS